jgi:hypothetical protein
MARASISRRLVSVSGSICDSFRQQELGLGEEGRERIGEIVPKLVEPLVLAHAPAGPRLAAVVETGGRECDRNGIGSNLPMYARHAKDRAPPALTQAYQTLLTAIQGALS